MRLIMQCAVGGCLLFCASNRFSEMCLVAFGYAGAMEVAFLLAHEFVVARIASMSMFHVHTPQFSVVSCYLELRLLTCFDLEGLSDPK